MTALLYFLVAMLAAGLSTRTWLADRRDPARLAFLGFGYSVTIAYVSFSLSLLPSLRDLRLLYMFSGMLAPPFALWCIDRVLARESGSPPSPYVNRLFAATAVLAPLLTGVEYALYTHMPRSSPAEWLAGIFAFLGFTLVLARLYEAQADARDRTDRVRLQYLLGVATAGIAFTVIEHIGRNISVPEVANSITAISTRVVVLQGPVPPISTLFAAAGLYFLYQILVMYRLLDVQELFSRLATLLVSALLLVVVDGLTLLWVGTFTDYPFHTTFQIFMASLLFLAAYDPVRKQIDWWSNRLFNQRGQQLGEALQRLHHELPTVISAVGVSETLLARLSASGRVPVCSVYLWDRSLDAFACGGSRGHEDARPLAAVAAHPFSEAFAEGEPYYFAVDVERRGRDDEQWAEISKLMAAQNAGLTIPFLSSSNIVLGWLNLRDEEWSDGFSADELLQLRRVGQLACTALSNIQEFQALEQAHRLAALGAMSAGLAHEIRNPLAGIKGAAQFLQDEDLPDHAQDMLSVVVEEANRLNLVVSQFLDYARPFELDQSSDHINALVTHNITVMRAQGLPDNVQLIEDLGGDLPNLMLDAHRISQVMLNLLQNGLQAMPDGGTLTVQTRRRMSRARLPVVEVVVSDTGDGISSDAMSQLFIPFFTTKEAGTGLGLPICQRIIEAHGGEIDVQSTEGRGSSFILRFPIHPDDDRTEERQLMGELP